MPAVTMGVIVDGWSAAEAAPAEGAPAGDRNRFGHGSVQT